MRTGLHDSICVLTWRRRDQGPPAASLLCGDMHRGSHLRQDLNRTCGGILTPDCQCPQLWEKKFLLLKPLSLMLLWHPNERTQVLFTLCHCFSFLLPDLIMSSFLSSSSLTLLPAQTCCLSTPVNFSFQLLTFQVQNFFLISFYNFSLFILCCSYKFSWFPFHVFP